MKSHSCLDKGQIRGWSTGLKIPCYFHLLPFLQEGPVFAPTVSKSEHVWRPVVESEINSSFQTVETAKCFQYAPKVGDGVSIGARCSEFQNYFLAYSFLLSQPPSPPFKRGGREAETGPILLLPSLFIETS